MGKAEVVSAYQAVNTFKIEIRHLFSVVLWSQDSLPEGSWLFGSWLPPHVALLFFPGSFLHCPHFLLILLFPYLSEGEK